MEEIGKKQKKWKKEGGREVWKHTNKTSGENAR